MILIKYILNNNASGNTCISHKSINPIFCPHHLFFLLPITGLWDFADVAYPKAQRCLGPVDYVGGTGRVTHVELLLCIYRPSHMEDHRKLDQHISNAFRRILWCTLQSKPSNLKTTHAPYQQWWIIPVVLLVIIS